MKILQENLNLKNMDSQKPILGVETSQSLCSACVYFSDNEFYEINLNLKYSHAEKLFEIIDFVITSAGIKINDLSSIAVSSGPGSFTGLRIGMSAAKGLAFGASLPVIPIPTFEALAFQVSTYLPENSEFIIANKVNAEEIYFAKFKISDKNYKITEKLKVLNRSELKKHAENTLIYGNALLDSHSEIHINKNNLSSPSSKYVAAWAELFGKDLLTFNYDYLEPYYLKNFMIKERKK